MSSFPDTDCRPLPDVREMLWASAGMYGTDTAFLEKKDGIYQPISYACFKGETEALGTALSCHLPAAARVLLIGKNSYAFALSLTALLCGAGVAIPADADLLPEELAELAAKTDANAVLYAPEQSEKIGALPGLSAICLTALPQLIAEGKELIGGGNTSFRERELCPTDQAAIFCTAGTTGQAKPVMLSQRNLMFMLSQIRQTQEITPTDTFLSVLPLSQIYECVLGFLTPLQAGAAVAFCEGLDYLMRNMREIHPTVMVTVPFIADAIYRKFWEMVKKRGTETQVRRIISVTDPVRPYAVRQAMKEKLLSRERAPFGGNLNLIFVAGDPLDPVVQKGLRQLGFMTLQAYGITECTGFAAIGQPGHYCDGSAGLPFPDGTLDIYNAQPDGSGEIRCRGDNVTAGYYGREAESRKVLRDGWFYTGDIGRFDENGFIHIVGRKQNCVEKADGTKICPEELEALLCQSPLIEEAAVVGVPDATGQDLELAALIFPDRGNARAILGGEPTDAAIESAVTEWIGELNSEQEPYRQIQLFALRGRRFERSASGRIVRRGLADEFKNPTA